MFTDETLQQSFGCPRCWPPSAEAAWAARAALCHQHELIDESHFHVMTLSCPDCAQPFLSVFTERIDWVDGDDPQSWALVPLAAPELAALLENRAALSESDLESIVPGRRVLRHSSPKGEPSATLWDSRLSVPPHD